MQSARRVAVGTVVVGAILVVVLGGLLGSLAGAGTESYDVRVAAFIGYPVHADVDDSAGTLVIAVNTPSGPHTELLGGNFDVRCYWPAEWKKDEPYYAPERVAFQNLGGGFYRVDVAPSFKWDDRQYVFMVTVSSSRGSGVGLAEFPVQLGDIPTIYNHVKD